MNNQLTFVIVTSPNDIEVENTLVNIEGLGRIILIDGGSRSDLNKPASDESLIVNLAKKFNADYHYLKYEYSAKSYNFGISLVNDGYIFVIDSDELLDETTKEWLKKETFLLGCVFKIKRMNYFAGRAIRHGHLGPDWNIRLFKKGSAIYEDRLVHARVVTRSKVFKVPGTMIHNSNTTVNSYFLKMIDYSTREIGARSGKNLSTEFKAKLRSQIQKLPFQGLVKFLYSYLWKLGFLDGKFGFQLSLTAAYYEVLVALKKNTK